MTAFLFSQNSSVLQPIISMCFTTVFETEFEADQARISRPSRTSSGADLVCDYSRIGDGVHVSEESVFS